ncbi:MAG: riboflavin synthase, partial [Patescibacteria group bacterium]
MFTGIVEATAEVLSNRLGELKIARPDIFSDVKKGASIAVAGACLTVTSLAEKTMAFDVVPETLKRTMLGGKKAGDHVNLERAMRADGRFEGHMVQGHVEGGGIVRAISHQRSAISITIGAAAQILRFVVAKGSLTIDGVSLPVVDGAKRSFSV